MPSVSYVYPSKPKAEVILINDTIKKISLSVNSHPPFERHTPVKSSALQAHP